VFPAEVREPDGQTIGEDRAGVERRAVDGGSESNGLFDGAPGRGAIGAMALDARPHFVIADAGGGNIDDPRPWGELRLRESGFTASRAAENECQHR